MGRGRGGGARGGGGPMPREVQVSKKLSWLLRHGADSEGLKIGKGGYVNLGEVLANRNIRSLKTNLDEIRQIVATNEKQRFSLIHASDYNSTNGENNTTTDATSTSDETQSSIITEATDDLEPSHYLIRANQGHSIKLEETDDLLTSITLEAGNLPAVVVHGTRHEHWPKILASGGLKPMGRMHIHFATGVPEPLRTSTSTGPSGSNTGAGTANTNGDEVTTLPDTKPAPAVLSGMRNSSTILIFINLKLALEKGLKFFMSANGVVLSAGDEEHGIVAIDVFEKVEERGGNILVKDGAVVAELDMSLARGAGGGGGGRDRGGKRGGRAGRGQG